MAETFADTFLQATELHRELGNKKAEIQRKEFLLEAAVEAVTEARGQSARAGHRGEVPRRCPAGREPAG